MAGKRVAENAETLHCDQSRRPNRDGIGHETYRVDISVDVRLNDSHEETVAVVQPQVFRNSYSDDV